MRRTRLQIGYSLIILLLTGHTSVYGQTPLLPAFSFVAPSGEQISDSDFRNGKPLLVVYFEPTCSHCQKQAQWIADAIDQFNGIDILFVAWEKTDGIPGFHDQYFSSDADIDYAMDTEAAFDEIFGFSQIPTLYLYNSSNQLIKKLKKETKAEKIIKFFGNR